MKLKNSDSAGIASAVGSGQPAGIGKLRIGWTDDNGKYHQYILDHVYHIPDSPVNILGISAFSKLIGDYETQGTRINSSG